MKIELSDVPIERARADVLVLAVTSDFRTDAAMRRLERAAGRRILPELERRRFKGAEGSGVLIAGGGRLRSPHLVIAGLGKASDLGPECLRRAADQVVARAREVSARSAALAFARSPAEPSAAIEALAEGAALAAYAFTEYRSQRQPVRLGKLVVTDIGAGRNRALAAALRRAAVLAGTTNQARTWINLPAAVMTPEHLAAEAERVGRKAGLEVEIAGRKGIAAIGMGALLAVTRGSVEEPRLIRMTYRPPSRPAKRLALIGKGITFDSGGLSLKTVENMEHMKRDMAGGAAVIATMMAIAALRPAVEVRAYVPACENMPGGSAMKPGDIVRTASGKTIEVVNTDAEGRLVLADALALAMRQAPDAIVDIATLTGAVRLALGTRVAGVMGNDRSLIKALIAAGQATGERLWELPLVAAYRADLESPVADLRNIASDGHGGAIHAGLFLNDFVGRRPWAHLDIAGVAFTDRELPYTPRGAVGFGVRLLTRWVLGATS